MKLSRLVHFFENQFSDLSRQYHWDASGKQVYLGDADISAACLALDPSDTIIRKAIETGCGLLITHHPLFFGELKNVTPDTPLGRKVIAAIQGGLTILSYHTNLDLADYSLNDHAVECLGASVCGSLKQEGRHDYVKIVTFVPAGHESAVIDAIGNAGGGVIGNYSKCTFRTEGTGTFLPGEGTTPFIGTQGELEQVAEFRIETIAPKSISRQVVSSIIAAHPYEEVAYDIYPLDMGKEYGIGRIGALPEEYTLSRFVDLIRQRFGAEGIRTNMREIPPFSRFAVVTGSGASLWKAAKKAGVNVLVTGDMKHHDALDAREAGICIIDAGHFETEVIYMQYLAKVLKETFGIETHILQEDSSIQYWR